MQKKQVNASHLHVVSCPVESENAVSQDPRIKRKLPLCFPNLYELSEFIGGLD